MKKMIFIVLSLLLLATSCEKPLGYDYYDIIVGVYGDCVSYDDVENAADCYTSSFQTGGGLSFEANTHGYTATIEVEEGVRETTSRINFSHDASPDIYTWYYHYEGEINLDDGLVFLSYGRSFTQFENFDKMNAFMVSQGYTEFLEPLITVDYDEDDNGDLSSLVGTSWQGSYDYYGVAVVETLSFTSSTSCTGVTEAGGDSITIYMTYTFEPETQTGTLTADSTGSFSISGDVLSFNSVNYYKQ